MSKTTDAYIAIKMKEDNEECHHEEMMPINEYEVQCFGCEKIIGIDPDIVNDGLFELDFC